MHALEDPIAIFLAIMALILVTPLLSERLRLPGTVGIILGGMLIGPNGTGLLSAESSIQMLATIGLLYLMFNAGLEVDLQQFVRVRQRAVVFGILTFLLPQLMGMGFGWLMGLDTLASVLLGSAFASHTLIALPILTRFGALKNEAVSVTTGATVMTDIGAFVVLSVVLSLHAGELDVLYFARLAILLGIYISVVLFGLPRLGKMFFHRFSGRVVEFQFILVALFVSALLAEFVGIHAVVGAFLAGLAINATLSHHNPTTGHILFLGESLFIPIFLLHSGMLTDPLALFAGNQTLMIALGVTVIAYMSKLLAALIAGRMFKYTRAEMMTIWGLSQAQAAVTIPTLVIGLNLGLFSQELFNAAIMMILLTSISSPFIVQRFAQKLRTVPLRAGLERPFRRILIPIANPDSQETLLSFAALMAHFESGELLVLHVARETPGGVGMTGGGRQMRSYASHLTSQLQQQRAILDRVHPLIQDPELAVELIPRLDSSVARGILRTIVERDVSFVILGWRGAAPYRANIFGSLLDEVVWRAPVPVAIVRLTSPVSAIRRVVLALPHYPIGQEIITRTLGLVVPLSNAMNAPLLVLSGAQNLKIVEEAHLADRLHRKVATEKITGELSGEIAARVENSDLVVMSTRGPQGSYRMTLGSARHSSSPEKVAAQASCSIIVVHYL